LTDNLEKQDINEVFRQLDASPNGLNDNQVSARLSKYGFNSVGKEKESRFKKFLIKFWSPVPWMLEFTALISYVLGKRVDTYIILVLLLFNSLVSFFQESKANNALELLENKMMTNARVLRNSNWTEIQSNAIVPGDIIHCRLGDLVPADVKIMSGEILVDQSALTGESNAVSKVPGNLLYSGSVLKRGESTGVVVATGSKTFFGKTAELVKVAKSDSHLEKLILSIVKYLITIDVVLVISLFIFSLIYGVDIYDTIPYSLVVLIASVPVALPATFTIASAYGAVDLSQKGALVTRLSAVEDAASLDAICFDKTGTLTQNRLSVSDPVAYGVDLKEMLLYAVLASDISSQDSIDIAVIDYAKSEGVDSSGYKIRKFIPFDPSTKRTAAVAERGGMILSVTKGAPQVILKLIDPADNVDVKNVLDKVNEMAARGYRTVGVARSVNGEEYRFCGLIPLHDQPRDDSASLIKKIKDLGIRPRMITGDSTPIALEIAREVGIGDKICKVPASYNADWDVEECDAFAEVLPEDKFNLVKALQSRRHITGMTGDGVNDAPALKQAEVGIAVATATDVAKASASIVLTHEGIMDIVSAIEDGRKIFQRMLTYTLNKIIKTVQVAIFLTLSFFIYRFFVTTPFDVILLIFANDFATMAIATDHVRFSNKPEKWNVRSLVGSSISLSTFMIAESFFVLWTATELGLTLGQIQTYIFDMLVFSGQFTVYMVRERKRFWNSRPSKWLIIASISDIIFVTAISATGILVTAIPLAYILLVLGIAFLVMVVADLFKNFIFGHYDI
jgi:H+-transporting ATPase